MKKMKLFDVFNEKKIEEFTSLGEIKFKDESKIDKGFDLGDEENGISYLLTMVGLKKMVVKLLWNMSMKRPITLKL